MTTAEIFIIVLTAILAITGVLGVVIFNGQLSAMQRQNQDGRDAFIISNRAFVFLSRYELNPILREDGSVAKWEVNPIFENTGPTPTKNLVIKINSQLIPVAPPDNEFPVDQEGPLNHGSMIRPHATATIEGPVITVEQIDQIVAGRQRFYIWGWAEYRDVFANTKCHRIRFFNSMKVFGDYRRRPGPDGIPLRMPVIGVFNDPDDECSHQ